MPSVGGSLIVAVQSFIHSPAAHSRFAPRGKRMGGGAYSRETNDMTSPRLESSASARSISTA